jgi:hypothetical protein
MYCNYRRYGPDSTAGFPIRRETLAPVPDGHTRTMLISGREAARSFHTNRSASHPFLGEVIICDPKNSLVLLSLVCGLKRSPFEDAFVDLCLRALFYPSRTLDRGGGGALKQRISHNPKYGLRGVAMYCPIDMRAVHAEHDRAQRLFGSSAGPKYLRLEGR